MDELISRMDKAVFYYNYTEHLYKSWRKGTITSKELTLAVRKLERWNEENAITKQRKQIEIEYERCLQMRACFGMVAKI